MKMRLLGVLVLSSALLDGCATVTFKAGASPDAMATDERACRGSTSGDAAYVDCMRAKGWFIARTDEAREPQAAEVSPPPPQAQTPVVEPAAPAKVEAVRPTPAVAAPAPPDVSPATPATAEPRVPTNAAAPAPQAAVAEPPAAPPPSSADSLPRVEVGSWWKIGGSAADLDRAIDACVAELGTPHRPEPGARIVTTAMRACLRAQGWYAFGKPGEQ